MALMVGFSGAVEDGVRGMAMVISLIVALLVGFLVHSFAIGFGVFIVGNVIGFVWAGIAGERFREQAFGRREEPEEVEPPEDEA